MARTAAELIDDVGQFMADKDDFTFSRVLKLKQINKVIQGRISSDTKCFVRQARETLRDDIFTYPWPVDMIELLSLNMEDVKGELVIPTDYSFIVRSGLPFNRTFITNPREAFEFNFARFGGRKIYFRELSSDNEFIFDPVIKGEDLTSGSTLRQDDVPDSAAKDDVWIDTFDNDKINIALTGYGIGPAVLTLDAQDLAGSTDLVFTAIVSGTKYFSVAFLDGGASGTSTLATSGSATRADPKVYSFTLFNDDDSNDAIIALLSGDPDITVTGADASTAGNTLDFGATPLVNVGNLNFVPFDFLFTYIAKIPRMSLETDTLNPAIPTLLQDDDTIAQLAASQLISMEDGGNRLLAVQLRDDAEDALERTTAHRNRTAIPQNIRPG